MLYNLIIIIIIITTDKTVVFEPQPSLKDQAIWLPLLWISQQ
jgi:hypothetical protein